MNLVLSNGFLDWLPGDSPESPPGDDVSNDAGHGENVRVLLINLKDDSAVLAETL